MSDLIKGLASGDKGSRQFAAIELGKLGPKARDAVPALARALEGRLVHTIRQAGTLPAWLHKATSRIAAKLALPLLLCYLSGLTRDEAAQQLPWSLGTLKRQLEQGRKALRIPLERRGITAVGLARSVLAPETLQAHVDKALIDSCLKLIGQDSDSISPR